MLVIPSHPAVERINEAYECLGRLTSLSPPGSEPIPGTEAPEEGELQMRAYLNVLSPAFLEAVKIDREIMFPVFDPGAHFQDSSIEEELFTMGVVLRDNRGVLKISPLKDKKISKPVMPGSEPHKGAITIDDTAFVSLRSELNTVNDGQAHFGLYGVSGSKQKTEINFTNPEAASHFFLAVCGEIISSSFQTIASSGIKRQA